MHSSKYLGKLIVRENFFSVIEAVKDCVKSIGVKGIFRGWVPLALEAPSHAIYFSITESSRDHINNMLKGSKIPVVFIDLFQSIISSILANTISLIPWIPAEILTSRLSIDDGDISLSMMIRSIYFADGIMGFFKGFQSSLVVHILYSFQWWLAYSTSRRQLEHFKMPPLVFDSVTGIFAGVISSVLSHPLDTLRLRMQTGLLSNTNIWDAFFSVLKSDGLKGLFPGLAAAVYSAAFSSAAFCVTYELIKRAARVKEPTEVSGHS